MFRKKFKKFNFENWELYVWFRFGDGDKIVSKIIPVWDHTFSMCTKLSEKLKFLPVDMYTYVHV